jgi:hypothetical protein
VCVYLCIDNSVIVSWDSKQSTILTLRIQCLNIFTKWHLPCAVSICTHQIHIFVYVHNTVCKRCKNNEFIEHPSFVSVSVVLEAECYLSGWSCANIKKIPLMIKFTFGVWHDIHMPGIFFMCGLLESICKSKFTYFRPYVTNTDCVFTQTVTITEQK